MSKPVEQKRVEKAPPALTPEEIAANERAKIKARCMKQNGICFAYIYRPHLGFADYAVIKLRLKEGVVEDVEWISDPLAAFEARAHMETKSAYHLEEMRAKYPEGFQHV